MALDPNFAWRQFKTMSRSGDAGAAAMAAAVPKCTGCGRPVVFGQGGRMDHAVFDALNTGHAANAERPTDEQLIAIGHPVPTIAENVPAGKKAAATRAKRESTGTPKDPFINKGRAKLGPKITPGQRNQIKTVVQNRNLGRQFNPGAFDEDGLMRSAADIFNGGSQEGNR